MSDCAAAAVCLVGPQQLLAEVVDEHDLEEDAADPTGWVTSTLLQLYEDPCGLKGVLSELHLIAELILLLQSVTRLC
jgi:hypothetical protein